MLAFSALVAGSFSFGGRIANDIDPAALTALRFMLAALVMAAVARWTGQLSKSSLNAPWRYLILGGLFSVYFVLMFEGLKTAAPVSTAAVFTLTPLMAAGFGYVVMRQRVSLVMVAALTVGGIGALWVIFRGNLSALLALEIGKGEIIFFCGCIAHALYIPMVPRLNRGEGVFAFTFGTLAGGSVILAVLSIRQISVTDWASLPPLVWLVLAYLVIFASVASISLIQYASMRLKAAKVMAYTYLIPTWVILWEFVLAGDVPTYAIVPGVGLTLLALSMLLHESAHPIRN